MKKITRRDFLKVAGVVGATAAMAGCAGMAPGAETAASSAASAATSTAAAGSVAAATGNMELTEPVQLTFAAQEVGTAAYNYAAALQSVMLPQLPAGSTIDITTTSPGGVGAPMIVNGGEECDLVMSNAGVQIVHPFEEYPFADWRKMMAIHADGAFLVSRAAYRRMKASGKGGRIVFTGSVQSFVGSKLKEPYNFAKHGVAGLAKAIAREGAEYGIYTYTICPSFIKTPLVEKQIPEQAASLGITEEEVVKNIMLRDTVDGVFTTVEDVANTLVFLSKDQGALTGQSLRLTHGWAMM